MKRILFMCSFVFLAHYSCLGQILSLQVNGAGGKYFYLTRDIYDQFYQVTYSGGWTGALETNLIVNKLGFPWLGINVGMDLKNCYRRETLRHYAHLPPTGAIAYTLSEGNIRWNFADFRILPEIKVLKKQRLYVFSGYYISSLYRIKSSGWSKTRYDTFPTSTSDGVSFEQILKNKDLSFEKQGLEVKKTQGISFGIRYVWRNFAFQLRNDYSKGKNAPYVWFDNHNLIFSVGYNIDFFR